MNGRFDNVTNDMLKCKITTVIMRHELKHVRFI